METDARTEAFLAAMKEANERSLNVPGVARIWLVRHADAYQGMRHLGSDVDPPLSAEGEKQAERLRLRLAGLRLDIVRCSPLLRARQTAAIAIAGREHPQMTEDPRLREVRTGWEGEQVVDPQPHGYRYPEPQDEVRARMLDAVHDCAAALPASGRALMVTHRAALSVLAASLLGLDYDQLRLFLNFTSVTVLGWHEGKVVIQSMGDSTHLELDRTDLVG